MQPVTEGTCWVKATATSPKITVTGDGRGVIGHAGARLLADLADTTGLTSAFGQALAGLRRRRGGHDPGRIAVDLTVMLADGGEAIADLAVLRNEAALFGPVASDPTAWRLLSQLDATLLAELRSAWAHAREIAWAQHADTRGDLPQPTVAGQQVDGLVLDMDATIVICHSEQESATRTWKKTFGFHPLLCFLDNTGEALAGLLREGRAGSSHGFLAHVRSLREQHLDIRFSVGAAITEPVREAIRAATGWVPAVDTDGDLREHAEVCEITGLFDPAGWPEGTRAGRPIRAPDPRPASHSAQRRGTPPACGPQRRRVRHHPSGRRQGSRRSTGRPEALDSRGDEDLSDRHHR